MDTLVKPTLVFFKQHNDATPPYIRLHLEQHDKCLSEFFNVIVINSGCDYQQVCDKYKPDLALFESSVYRGRTTIRNTSSCHNIPKLGFINADSYCVSRDAILSDMDRWGIETF